jgi:predicted neuraminidase
LRGGIVVAAASLLALAWSVPIRHVAPTTFAVPAGSAPAATTGGASAAGAGPIYTERFASGGETEEVHASSAYAQHPDGLTAFWYGGSKEGAADVAIYAARFGGSDWAAPQKVVERSRATTELRRHIKKLGNAIVYRHPDGRLWLFFVSVSIGGWATSAVNLIESLDDGQSWSPARRLVTTPFLNVSTLVRSSVVPLADGSIGLPVYHEFLGKFAELLRIAPDGRILSKTRLSSGRHALQPEIAVLDEQRAVALMRNGGKQPRRVLRATTLDSGRTWSTPVAIAAPNPDAALDVIELDSGSLLAVMNDDHDKRERLILATSANLGVDWHPIKVLDEGGSGRLREYSYPWLMRAPTGQYHVFYTWNRVRIKHVAFNEDWLDDARAGAGKAAKPTPP